MKLLRYGPRGAELPGVLDSQHRIRSLIRHIPDIGPAQISSANLRMLSSIDINTLPIVEGSPRLGIPIANTRKFIGVGLNYADHVAEAGLPMPTEPPIFTKAVSSLQGPNDDVMLPRCSQKTDWEVELGIVIGTTARYVEENAALEYVAGYVIVNDVSEREYQMERGGTWDKGKGCDTFGPVGPWLVTQDEIVDVQALPMWLDVNDVRMQTGNTRSMIFGVATLVSYLSRFMTLEPGDIITTGTPPGVGMGQKPAPIYLRAGDVMRLGIEGLGKQHQTVAPFSNPEIAKDLSYE
jgi:2-keto-4-pentenoate hydratase/2-oxohepta-3-ene-1,7-dioic acid hydratase in catechol pathway